MGYKTDKKTAYANLTLVALNVAYFLFLEVAGSSSDTNFMVKSGALYAPMVMEQREYYRLLTSMFMHFGISHIMNNMLILFILGDNLERALGKIKYLIFYLICGIGANTISMFMNIREAREVVSAGASGAIFGVVGGLLYVVTVNRGHLEDLSSRQLVVVIACSLYFGFTSTGVDNAAHVSGLVLGIIMAMLFYRKPKNQPERNEFLT